MSATADLLSKSASSPMRRRQFLRLAGGAAGLGLAGNLPGAPPPNAPRPNIILIYADDLGYGDLGCYGHPTIRTPNLDRMAAEGMRFTQFYAGAPLCTPSRATLLTGRLAIRSGLTRVLFPWSTGGLPDDEFTVAEGLKTAGYRTACIGKWHLGHRPPYLPTRHGFEDYFGIPYSNDMSKSNPEVSDERYAAAPDIPLIRGEQALEYGPDQGTLTRRYTEEALQFMRRADKKPFFLYLAHTFPHVPLFASNRFRNRSPRGLYGDVVEELDWSTGEILRAVEKLGLARNTLVIFTSDNGPWLLKREHGGSAGLFREGKGSTWEGGMREPFIARWSGHIPAGVVSTAFGTTMDLFSTCLTLGGAAIPADRVIDGRDLSPVLLRNQAGRDPLLFYYQGAMLCAVRKGPWKLHVAANEPASRKPQPAKLDPPLLFHLEHDPSEKSDVAAAKASVVHDLQETIAEHNRTLKPGQPQQ